MNILMFLYRIFLYPYLEIDKYYEELGNDVFENDMPRILIEMGYEESVIKKVCNENNK